MAAVWEVHSKRVFNGDGYGWEICAECRQAWPCATEQAVAKALGRGDVPMTPEERKADVVAVLAAAMRQVRCSPERRQGTFDTDTVLAALADAGYAVVKLPERNRLAEAFIRGVEAGAEEPSLAGDGDAMYQAFRLWADGEATP